MAKDFVRKSNQLLYKITAAKPLIDWFYKMDRYHIIYQVRHPISNALSIMRLGWGLTTRTYLTNTVFIRKYLSDDLLAYSFDILDGEDEMKKHVLNWCLESLAPLKSSYLYDWTILSYEEMVLYPEKTVILLKNKLELNDENDYAGVSQSAIKKLSVIDYRIKKSDVGK